LRGESKFIATPKREWVSSEYKYVYAAPYFESFAGVLVDLLSETKIALIRCLGQYSN
jgi:hypothetical protein